MGGTMELFQLREHFSREGIMMCFNGPFSHSIIEEMGIAMKNHLSAANLAKVWIQDLFAVYVEMTQNVTHYLSLSPQLVNENASATVVIAKQGETYTISSGNVVLKKDVEKLADKINHINTLDSDGLKKMIRQQLRCEVAPGAKGAGIGLMEIAKRCKKGLEYNLMEIDDGLSFFTLKITL